MTYYAQGIDKVFWEYSKRGMHFESYEQLLAQLSVQIDKFLQHDYGSPHHERDIVQLAIHAFSNYSKSGLMRPYDIQDMFMGIIGDPIVESIFGVDERTTMNKVLVAILGYLRNQQVRASDGEVLIDWEQK